MLTEDLLAGVGTQWCDQEREALPGTLVERVPALSVQAPGFSTWR